MKKRLAKIVRAVIFLAALFVMINCANNVLRQTEDRYNREMFPAFYAEEKNSIDVVTIGSSACYQYVNNPVLYEKYGITSFNLSTALQPPSIAGAIMDEAEKTQRPALYVVEVREYLHMKEKQRTKSVFCVTDSIDLSLNKWKLICRAYPDASRWVSEFLDITKYHGKWTSVPKEALSYIWNRVPSLKKTWRNRMVIQAQNPPAMPDELEPLSLSDLNRKDLVDLLKACREKNREVLFVLMPYIHGSKIPGQALTLQQIVEEYGYQFLNLADPALCPMDYSRDFYNKYHVNAWGSEKVTEALGAYIREQYGLAIPHTPSVEASWDAAVAANRAEMDAAGPYGENRKT